MSIPLQVIFRLTENDGFSVVEKHLIVCARQSVEEFKHTILISHHVWNDSVEIRFTLYCDSELLRRLRHNRFKLAVHKGIHSSRAVKLHDSAFADDVNPIASVVKKLIIGLTFQCIDTNICHPP